MEGEGFETRKGKKVKEKERKKGEEQAAGPDTNRLVADKKAKVEELRAAGINPYANDFRMEHGDLSEVCAFDEQSPLPSEDGITDDQKRYKVAGRVMAAARFGKAAFFMVRYAGKELQIYVRRESLDEDQKLAFRRCEVGDHIGAEGPIFRTRKGKPALRADVFRLLTKAQRPLPEKYHGLKDHELRYRMRYVDLVMNPEVAEVFKKRASMIAWIRRFLDVRGFIEVETPMMHPLIGGAAARPFITKHNALDMTLFMRIAPELYLKRLLVGGLERVYEINRCFRNEGLSRKHNPEFTMLEFYQSYATYKDLMVLSEVMISELVLHLNGGLTVSCPVGESDLVDVDFRPPWPKMSFIEATARGMAAEGLSDPPDEKALSDDEVISRWVERSGLLERDELLARNYNQADSWGERLNVLFERFGEPNLPKDRPVFVVDYPGDISPLSRRNDLLPQFVDRFEIFVTGQEIGNAFSELNDPEDQRARFVRQMEQKKRGAQETMDYDEDYCRALEFGMPPAGGEGIGIDRLAMLMCGQRSIRDVILFPLLRPSASIEVIDGSAEIIGGKEDLP